MVKSDHSGNYSLFYLRVIIVSRWPCLLTQVSLIVRLCIDAYESKIINFWPGWFTLTLTDGNLYNGISINYTIFMVWIESLLSTGCIIIFYLGETLLMQRFKCFSITCGSLIIYFHLQCFNTCCITFWCFNCVLDGENILEGCWCRRVDQISKNMSSKTESSFPFIS